MQPKKMARRFKFRIKEEEGWYYLCIENNGAVTTQLIGGFSFAYAKSRFLGSPIYIDLFGYTTDRWAGIRTAGRQVGRYTCVRLHMSNCQHADLPLIQGLSYI